MSNAVVCLPSVSQTLVDTLARKEMRGEVAPLIWRRLVFRELSWCVSHLDELTARHRDNACKLLDWYYRQVGEIPESFASLYPARERYRRCASAELDWCSRHVSNLSPRRRDKAIDLMSSLWESDKFYCSWWSQLHWK